MGHELSGESNIEIHELHRSFEVIEADLKALETEVAQFLAEAAA